MKLRNTWLALHRMEAGGGDAALIRSTTVGQGGESWRYPTLQVEHT